MLDYTNSATLYLSQAAGNDSSSGFAPLTDPWGNGPVKTMDRITELLHTMRSSGFLQPVTVKIMGDLFLDKPIAPGFADVTSFFSPDRVLENVTFESWGDTRSRIIGGKKLTGFRRDIFQGVACFSLFLPEVKDGSWHFTDLYVNGKRAEPTRYPKTGTLQAVTTEFPDPERFDIGSKWFIANKPDLADIDDIENATVSFYHYWIDEHSPVESYDRETGKLTMALRSRFKLTTHYQGGKESASDLNYYLENVSSAFSEANSWYLDVKNGMLYYIPEDPCTPEEQLEVFAPVLTQLVSVRGTAESKLSGIRFRNLEFLCTRGDYRSVSGVNADPSEEGRASDPQSLCNASGAIQFLYTENSGLFNCTVRCTGLHAVQIGHGCSSIRIENCCLEELGGGGISLYGRTVSEPAAMQTGHCVVRGCTIRSCGRRYAAACGILVRHCSDNDISDNEICYTDYTGISVGWVWGYRPSTSRNNLIRRNHIHHIGMGRLSDMGGIYLLGPQSGTVVEENHIHDINSAHYGGWGIYTDEGSSYICIERNTVYRCKFNCFHQHYGSFNTVRENVFAFSGHEIAALTRNEAHIGAILEHNTYITDGKPVYRTLTDGKANSTPGGFLPLQSNRNRIWDTTEKEPALTFSELSGPVILSDWQRIYGKDEGSTVEKPEDTIFEKLSDNP